MLHRRETWLGPLQVSKFKHQLQALDTLEAKWKNNKLHLRETWLEPLHVSKFEHQLQALDTLEANGRMTTNRSRWGERKRLTYVNLWLALDVCHLLTLKGGREVQKGNWIYRNLKILEIKLQHHWWGSRPLAEGGEVLSETSFASCLPIPFCHYV